MIYFISRQRVSIKTCEIIKNARRRLLTSIEASSDDNARRKFELEFGDSSETDITHRYELTDGKWRHICYMQEGIIT